MITLLYVEHALINVHRLMGSIHETILYVSKKAIINNVSFFRSKLKKSTKIIAVLKAFAYGNGDIKIAEILELLKVDAFWVADFEEGVNLRKSNINTPIIIANPGLKSINQIVEYNLEVVIYNFKLMRKFGELNQKINIHLKFNTGMNRFGFDFLDINEIISCLNLYPSLKVCSVCSHLASSDNKLNDIFSKKQFIKFSKICELLDKKIGNDFDKHILNSNGIIRFPSMQYNAVRIGIGLFGNITSKKTKKATSLISVISQVRIIKKGEFIGYNLEFIAKQNVRIAIVPFGYADGLDRRLGNGTGKLFVDKQMCEILGNISMDSCCINITNTSAEEGDLVEIFGENILVEDIVKLIGTTPYEFLSKINRRIKRIYI